MEVGEELTFFRQDSDADAGVAKLDERGIPSPPILLPDQQNIFGTNIPMDKMLFLLQVQNKKCVQM